MSPSKAVVKRIVVKATLQKPMTTDSSCRNDFVFRRKIMGKMWKRVSHVRMQKSMFGREKIRRRAHSDASEQIRLKK